MSDRLERTDVWEQVFPLRSGGRLEVDQDVGRVDVTSWDRDEARVRGTKRAQGLSEDEARRRLDRLTLRAHLHGSRLEVDAGAPRGLFGSATGTRVDLEITVPRSTRVKIDTASGGVSVERVEGFVEVDVASGDVALSWVGPGVHVDTGSGNVVVEDAGGPVVVDTGSGRVEIIGVDGEVHVDTGSGPVQAAAVRGDIEIDTGTGDVHLSRVEARQIHVDTGRGVITADFDPRLDGRYKFDTASGRIEVTVPAGAGAELDLETNAGRAECDLPLLNRFAERGLLRGVLGRSSCRIICRSGLGDIMVKPGFAPAPAEPLTDSRAWAAEPAVPSAPATRAADEDIAKILKMVEEKRLTPEAAEELLRALEEEEPE